MGGGFRGEIAANYRLLACGVSACALAACFLSACGAGDEGSARDRGGLGANAGSGPVHSGAGGSAGSNGFSNSQVGVPKPPTMKPNGEVPSDICEAARVTADPQTPDMMIVLDRSGSMKDRDVNRWDPSVSALRAVTMQLQSKIHFGLAMFPDPMAQGGGFLDCLLDPNACDNATCSPGRVVVDIAPDNAPAIDMALSMASPGGGTPTPQTLMGLVDTYAGGPADPDAVPAPKFILLVTDGQPTCPNGNGGMVTQPDIDASNAAIEALAAKGVRTFVIGYDTNTPGNEMLKAVLDGFAQRGGTGDMEHHPVEDEASLLATLESITAKIAGCSFRLEMAPPRADYVRVTLDGNQINLDEPDGWKLVDEKTVELQGAACATLMSPAAHALDVQVECEIVPPE
jgi:hypothetical protein